MTFRPIFNNILTAIAVTSLVVVLLPASFSQTVTNTAPDTILPAHHWAYYEIDVLRRGGIYIGKTGTGDGRDLTPNDVAQALIYLLPLLSPNTFTTNDDLIDAKADLHTKIDTNPSAIDALVQLIDGFTPELTGHGKDAATARACLVTLMEREINKEQLAPIDRAQESVTHSAPEIMMDVPENRWAFHDVDILQKAGVVIGFPDVQYSSRPLIVRSEFARDLVRILSLVQPDNSSLNVKDNLAAAKADLQSKLVESPDTLEALNSLVCGFEPDLTALGEDVPNDKARIYSLQARCAAVLIETSRVYATNNGLNIIARAGQAGSSFHMSRQQTENYPNNPSNHWAYQAVAVLHSAGFNIGFDPKDSQDHSLTREQIASGIAVILPLMWQDETDVTNYTDLDIVDPYLQSKIDANPGLLTALDQLVDGFKPDLAAIGVNIPPAKLRLNSLLARESASEARNGPVKKRS